jgi:hypothetical protein
VLAFTALESGGGVAVDPLHHRRGQVCSCGDHVTKPARHPDELSAIAIAVRLLGGCLGLHTRNMHESWRFAWYDGRGMTECQERSLADYVDA